MKVRKKIHEKGELMSQPILFIFAAIVGALILFFGIRLVFNVKGTGELVEVSSFITNLNNDVEQYYNFDPGSSKVVKLDLPVSVKNVCFKNRVQDTLPSGVDSGINTLMQLNKNDNVFVYPAEGKASFKIKNMLAYPNNNIALCFKNKDEIKITSLGDHVAVSTKTTVPGQTTSTTAGSSTSGGGLNLGVTLNPEDLNFIRND